MSGKHSSISIEKTNKMLACIEIILFSLGQGTMKGSLKSAKSLREDEANASEQKVDWGSPRAGIEGRDW